jgi:DNA primase
MERQQINQLKSLSIESYLQSSGMEPAKLHGQKLYYHSPFRSDTTPSFVVNLDSNTFKDFADSEKPEDIIRLVQRLHGLNFNEACQHLANWTNSAPPKPFLSNGNNSTKAATNEKALTILETKVLDNYHLIQYLKSRKIDLALSYLYLIEIIYECKEKRYRGIGFKNNSGGYEIRSAMGMKLTTRPKDFTYFPVKGSRVISVFEGFFDFLSALMYHNTTASKHSVLVLNSTSNVTKSLPIISQYETINAYLDQDETGKKALAKLKDNGLNVIDGSTLYNGFKDFNEFWQATGTV